MALDLNLPLANVATGKLHVGNRTISKRTVIVLGVTFVSITAVLIYLYYKNPKFRELLQKFLNLGNIVNAVDVADAVSFQLLPPEVRPNSQFTIAGAFFNKDGKPATVKNAYYFVFLDQNLLVQGSIGQNVSAFNVVVPTVGFVNGKKYTVRVSDQPLLNPPMTNANIMPPKFIPTTGMSVTG